MADPNPRPPDTAQRGDDINLYRHSADAHARRVRKWIWLLAIAAVFAGAFWAWHDNADITRTKLVHAAPAARAIPATKPPVLDVHTLLKTKPADIIGKQVVLRDVLIQNVSGDDIILIGSHNKHEVLVVPEPNAVPQTRQNKPEQLRSNEVVTVSGTVADLPSSELNMRDEWKLSPPEIKQVQKTGFYVKGADVRPQHY